MTKALYSIAFLAFFIVGTAARAQDAYPVVDPGATSVEITGLLADAKPDEAVAALEKALPPLPSNQFNLEQLKSAFKMLTRNGAATVKDEVQIKKYGESVQIIIHYVYFPRQEVPANHFLFLRYTFMKGGDGWMMTTFDFKTSGVFPPPGWSD